MSGEDILESLQRPIYEEGEVPTAEELDSVLDKVVGESIEGASGKVGMLLSGGVDSTTLLAFVSRFRDIPVFTVAESSSHPDFVASKKLAEDLGLEHYYTIPTQEDRERAKVAVESRGTTFYKGDDAVYLAAELASKHGVKVLLASDGIDELTGGYWWHRSRSDRFPTQEGAFEHFWGALEEQHLVPLSRSGRDFGVEVKYPYLDDRVVSILTRIPLSTRAPEGTSKAWWKDFARSYVPDWVVDRPKLGFVDALEEKRDPVLLSMWEGVEGEEVGEEDVPSSLGTVRKKKRKISSKPKGSRGGTRLSRVDGSVVSRGGRFFKPTTGFGRSF
ncbi:hypothetical protein LCGC14_1732330 [marine sediment metagenome]|uniref:Asparagine synthetase domain-containing protein n=1 Tax=marine sediment metagenome TaxID=412755 RepID=A0A0F9HWU9_9ZZZZ